MHAVWLYSLGSVLIISLIALIGILTLSIKKHTLKKVLIHMVSFSAGSMFGGAFLHLLPEAVEEAAGFTTKISVGVLLGIALFFIIEKLIHWRHCHMPITKDHVHPFAIMNLVGDAVHNLIDGIIIAVSYVASIPVGIAATIAVALHEIPQEIGDFGVLIHGGFSTKKALMLNFVTALASVAGVVLGILLTSSVDGITELLIPLAAGGFIYIAGADLIPELHKECETKQSILQLISFFFGVAVMYSLLFLK